MSIYKFKLQKLLDIRLEKEEESIRFFKKAQEEKELVEEKLVDLKKLYSKYSNFEYKLSVVEKKMRFNYLKYLSKDIKNTEEELVEKINEFESKRNDLIIRQIERKTVGILKEKKKLAFIKEQNLAEQKITDELALYGHIRKNKINLKGGE